MVMIKFIDKSDVTTNPFVVSKKWYSTDTATTSLLYTGLNLSDLSNPILNYPYTQSIIVIDGISPYIFEITSGSLPIGLTMNMASGEILGVPTMVGNYNFSVNVVDVNGVNGNRNYNFELLPPTILLSDFISPTFNVSCSQVITASGGTFPYTFEVTDGELPTGLTMNVSGAIVGVPTAACIFNFTIKATDVNGYTGNKAYSVEVLGPSGQWWRRAGVTNEFIPMVPVNGYGPDVWECFPGGGSPTTWGLIYYSGGIGTGSGFYDTSPYHNLNYDVVESFSMTLTNNGSNIYGNATFHASSSPSQKWAIEVLWYQ